MGDTERLLCPGAPLDTALYQDDKPHRSPMEYEIRVICEFLRVQKESRGRRHAGGCLSWFLEAEHEGQIGGHARESPLRREHVRSIGVAVEEAFHLGMMPFILVYHEPRPYVMETLKPGLVGYWRPCLLAWKVSSVMSNSSRSHGL